MKTVKTTIITMLICSTSFAGVGFYMGTGFNGDGDVTAPAGFSIDLNETTTIGYDNDLGLMAGFDMPAGPVNVTMRMGWYNNNTPDDATDDTGSVGVGYNWWTGGAGVKTSLGTSLDYTLGPDGGADFRVNVGFGF